MPKTGGRWTRSIEYPCARAPPAARTPPRRGEHPLELRVAEPAEHLGGLRGAGALDGGRRLVGERATNTGSARESAPRRGRRRAGRALAPVARTSRIGSTSTALSSGRMSLRYGAMSVRSARSEHMFPVMCAVFRFARARSRRPRWRTGTMSESDGESTRSRTGSAPARRAPPSCASPAARAPPAAWARWRRSRFLITAPTPARAAFAPPGRAGASG